MIKEATDSTCEHLGSLGDENLEIMSTPRQIVRRTYIEWFSTDVSLEDNFLHLLIRISVLVLLHAPYDIYCRLEAAGISSNEVTPKSVISSLRKFKSIQPTCKITNLPQNLENTAVKSVQELSGLIKYCSKDTDFGEHLEGIPLLLTQDGYLQVFKSCQLVFYSEFGDLFPTHLHSFVHSAMVNIIPQEATLSQENIVCEFAMKDLQKLLPYVFTDQVLTAIKDTKTWKHPAEGPFSEQWFQKLWNFLQNYAKPDCNEDFVSLGCLPIRMAFDSNNQCKTCDD